MFLQARGIGCDEATGLLIDTRGLTSVVSRSSTGACYLLQATQPAAECSPSYPLSVAGIAVARLMGNATNCFDLSTWKPQSPQVTLYSINVHNAQLSAQGNNGRIY